MLVLSRKKNEGITIVVPPSDKEQVIKLAVVEIRGDKVRIGTEAEKCVVVHRDEVFHAIERQLQERNSNQE